MRFLRPALLVLFMLTAVACGGSPGPTAPSADLWVTGTWTGTIQAAGGLSGTLTLSLTHAESGAITGTARIDMPGFSVTNAAVTSGIPPRAVPPVAAGIGISAGGPCPVAFSAPSTFSTRQTLEGAIGGLNTACGIELSGTYAVRKS